MSFRDTWDPVLAPVARRLAGDELDARRRGRVAVHHYYCTSVMDVVRHLRRFTRARDEQGQHDVLKIVFKRLVHGDRGRYEVRRGRTRLDIWIDDAHEAIEVKTIVDVTVSKVKGKLSLVLRLKRKQRRRVDRLWVVFFYKFKDGASPRAACKYLLCWVDMDLAGITNTRELEDDVVALMHKSKKAVAEKLNVDESIIIPVENIMLVEDLERELKEKDALLDEKDKIIDEKDALLDEKDKVIDEKDKVIDEHGKALDKLAAENLELKRRLGIK